MKLKTDGRVTIGRKHCDVVLGVRGQRYALIGVCPEDEDLLAVREIHAGGTLDKDTLHLRRDFFQMV